MSELTVLTYKDQRQAFLQCLEQADIAGLPKTSQLELESRYRSAEFGDGFQDLSFCILASQKPEAFVVAHKTGDMAGFRGSGAEILEKEHNNKRTKLVLQHLADSAKGQGCKTLKVNDNDIGRQLSPLGQALFNLNAVPQLKLRAIQTLEKPEKALFGEIRSSYRNLINRSRQEIRVTTVTCEQLDKALFEDFRKFHKAVAGRQTRPLESWQVQWEMIEAGQAELMLGYMEPHGLVSSALFTDYGWTTIYGVAVYERALFDKPLAHAMIHQGMLSAKRRGQQFFDLGIVPPYHPQFEKEFNIGNFKKGFCRRLSSFVEWQIAID